MWTASTGSRGVLVANNAQINYIKSLYPPNTPAYNQRFALAVYEDDNTANQVIEKHPNYSGAVFGASLLVPRIQLTLIGSNPPFISNTLAAAGFFILFQEVYNLTQLDDDFVGLVVDAQQWSGYSGVQVPRTHVVLIDNYKIGEINLQFYP